VKPLTALTTKETPFDFDKTYKDAFIKLKQRLLNALLFRYYNFDLEIRLETDASNSICHDHDHDHDHEGDHVSLL
jgi:hypothetical protein